jgi:Tol biopolymer transport system component
MGHHWLPRFAALAAFCLLTTMGLASAGRALGEASGVVLTARGGRILAVNTDGSGVKELTGPGSAADPVASPDGSAIAFDDRDGLYVMKADGTERIRLASGTRPEWSPDGQWLAYQGKSGLYVVRPDGTATHRVARATGFSWSPDATSLAYPSTAGVSAVNVATGARRVLVRGVDAANLAWSPDGHRIAFRGDSYADSPVYVAVLGGSKPRRIGPRTDQTPAWSPDGTRVAYGSGACCRWEGARSNVVEVDVSSGRTVMAVPPLARTASGYPSWSPDGTRLAFKRTNTAGSYFDEGGADVWVVNADGTGLSHVTTAFPFAGVASPPTWWPRRLKIAPDPGIRTVALHTVARRRLGGSYTISGADATRVAIVRSSGGRTFFNAALGVWRGPGRIDWIRDAGGDSAAFAGLRVYWTTWSFIPGYFDAYLWTAARPGRRPRVLRQREESSNAPGPQPLFTVRDDGSLAVYTLHGSLWRLRGARSRRIRHEGTEFSLFAVGGGRILLQRSDRRVELVSSSGKLMRTIASRAKYIGGALSGRRLVLVGSQKISVFDSRTGQLRTSWPVGAPGVPPSMGFMYKSLLPYSDGSALHVLDVDTGHDLIVRIPGVTEPVTEAVTKAGLVYTWTQTYSTSPGRMAVVPLPDLIASLKAA